MFIILCLKRFSLRWIINDFFCDAAPLTRTGACGTFWAPRRGCSGLHLTLYSIHDTATNRRCAMLHSNIPPVKKQIPLTMRSSSLKCVLAAERQTAEQYSKTGWVKRRKHLVRAIYHEILARTSSGFQVFEKLHWKPSEDTSQMSSWNQMSLPIYEGHQTHSSQFRH